MIIKIFSGSNTTSIEQEIRIWFDEMEEIAFDSKQEFQIISVTQSESDGIINVTIIAK